MNGDEFRAAGHELVEWAARYLDGLDDVRVTPDVEPGWVRAQLPDAPPAAGKPFAALLSDLDRVVLPGTTHWQSPRFMAYFPCNGAPVSALGELAIAVLNQQGMLWATSPAATEIESHVCDWLVDVLGLPPAFRTTSTGGGAIQDAASTSNFVAAVAAREAATGGDSSLLASLRAYTSVDAHSSVEKGVRLAGLSPHQLRAVEVDGERRLRADVLERLVADDVAAGHRPFFVASTVGTTSFLAVDPVAAVGAVARRHRLWHHVDAAMAGTAGLAGELRPLVTDGLDTVDSYCFDPHKWLGAGMDCDVLYVADRSRLIAAMSVVPEYLRNPASESGDVIDYRDWGVALGRRFRALKLWWLLRSVGTDELTAMVRRHVALAADLAARVEEHPALELVVPARLNLVCLVHRDGDAATRRLLDAVNRCGALATHTRLDGRLVLRLVVGSWRTEQRHVDAVWEAVVRAT